MMCHPVLCETVPTVPTKFPHCTWNLLSKQCDSCIISAAGFLLSVSKFGLKGCKFELEEEVSILCNIIHGMLGRIIVFKKDGTVSKKICLIQCTWYIPFLHNQVQKFLNRPQMTVDVFDLKEISSSFIDFFTASFDVKVLSFKSL